MRHSKRCDKACEVLAKIKCERPCYISIEPDSDVLVTFDDMSSIPPRPVVVAPQVPPRAVVVPPKAVVVPPKAAVVPPKAANVPPRAANVPPKAAVVPPQVPPRAVVVPPQVPPKAVVVPPQVPPKAAVVPPQVPPKAVVVSDRCKAIQGFINNINSCYLDSVLFALFAFDSKFIREQILDVDRIQIIERMNNDSSYERYSVSETNRIVDYIMEIQGLIRGVNEKFRDSNFSKEKFCVNLRNKLLTYPSEILKPKPNKLWSSSKQQDASEFLICIFNTFLVNNIITTRISQKVNTTKSYMGPTETIIEKPTGVISINAGNVNNLNDYFTKKEVKELSVFDELVSRDSLENPEVIRLSKIKLMFNIYYYVVSLTNAQQDQFAKYLTEISKKNPSGAMVYNKVKATDVKSVDDLDYNNIQDALEFILNDLRQKKVYTAALIAKVNTYKSDKTKGYYLTHQDYLNKIIYYNRIENTLKVEFLGETTPYLVISLARFLDVDNKNRKRVDFEETMSISGSRLSLNSIVIHQGRSITGGHYMTAFRCNDQWYLYNDMPGQTITRIGSFRDLLTYKMGETTFLTDATVFIYNTENNNV